MLDYEYQFYETKEEKTQYIENLRDGRFTLGKPNIRYRVLHSISDGSRTLCIKVDHGSYGTYSNSRSLKMEEADYEF
jgi:hypothetical protein